jgi:hypothetical protein
MLVRMTHESASHSPAVFRRDVTDIAGAEMEARIGKPVLPFPGKKVIPLCGRRAFRQEQFILSELICRSQKALAAVLREGTSQFPGAVPIAEEIENQKSERACGNDGVCKEILKERLRTIPINLQGARAAQTHALLCSHQIIPSGQPPQSS